LHFLSRLDSVVLEELAANRFNDAFVAATVLDAPGVVVPLAIIREREAAHDDKRLILLE
jgi:hypothetical protein